MWMQEDLSRKQSQDHCHTLQTSKPMTTSDSTRKNCKRQLKTESRTHHTKGRPTCKSGRPASQVGRLAGPLQSLFALHRLVCISKIYTVNFKAVLSRFIQQWSRELTRIDDMAMPCPPLHLPYISSPLPHPSGHQSMKSHLWFRSRYTIREKPPQLSRCRSRIVKLRVRES